MLIYIIMLSVSLSIDALGIGAALGIRGIRLSFTPRLIMALLCFTVTYVSILTGKVFSMILPPDIAPAVSAVMLTALGMWIIVQALKKSPPSKKEQPKDSIYTFIIKSLGITIQIIRSPQYCDLDGSHSIDIKEALYLGTVLSIDSFGAGFGSGMGSLTSPLIPFFTAVSQTVFITLGSLLGKRISTDKNENIFTVISGMLIIIIGLSKLL